MSTFQVDLTNCDIEPIHIPGQIQSHGFLLVIDENFIIRYHSDNISQFIPGITQNILGENVGDIEALLGAGYQSGIIKRIISSGLKGKDFERTNPAPVEINGNGYYLIISVSKGYHLLEFESAVSNFDLDVQSMMGQSIADILTYRKTQSLLDNTVAEIRKIIEFDRIMIYRFAPDGHGEVIAEAKNEGLESWLGLHYPASDIPKQAKDLYKLNLTRLIADVNTTPSKISTAADNTDDLDLTYSQLRAVSPIHIQYLKNMGVASSFSISLKYKDELWGLIACHNYTPRFIDYKSREYAKLIGQILSSALEFRQDEETQHAQDTLKQNLEKVARQLLVMADLPLALITGPVTLLDVVNGHGAILAFDKKIYKLGLTPNDEQLLPLFSWINQHNIESVFQTNSLSYLYPEAETFKDVGSGMMVSVLSRELGDYLVWFKPEQIQTIRWAGNPNKPTQLDANGMVHISPRHSFDVWADTVTGISADWTTNEIEAAGRLRDDINFNINQKAGTVRLMNERLRVAYEELESFSYTISHDLKNPIASIKSYAQLLLRDQNVLERGQKMLQRIADRADQMNLMINAVLDYSRIGRSLFIKRKIVTAGLVADIIHDLYISSDIGSIKITVGDMPDIKGDPIMILQVFSNLISNAVKYSQDSNPSIVHIEGKVNDNDTSFTITDNGLGIAPQNLSKIFELFNRMENVSHIEGSGVGLAIVKRIVEKHDGKIWAKSELGQGTTFFVSFRN